MADRRVVWLTALPPHHEGTGGQLRQAHLLDAVAARTDVVLMCAGPVDDPAVREAAHEVVEVPAARRRPDHGPLVRAELLTHWALGRVPLATSRAAGVRRALRRAAAEVVTRDDLVVIEHLELAPLAAHLPPHARTVLTIHHAEAHQAAQELDLASSARQRSWWRREQHRARRLEHWTGRHVDTVVTVSRLDASVVACESTVVPNGTVVPDAPSTPPPGDRVVVFTGDLAYGPNVDGITWFVASAWPAVRDAVPDAVLRVVGRAPAPAVRDLAAVEGVEVHPDVPTIAPHLEAADVAIVPLRLGGGTRLKALQAMAAGRPVVGTAIGLEGLDARDGDQVRLAEGGDELAAAVVELLRDRRAARAVAARARDWVAAHHDWRGISRAFAEDVLGL